MTLLCCVGAQANGTVDILRTEEASGRHASEGLQGQC